MFSWVVIFAKSQQSTWRTYIWKFRVVFSCLIKNIKLHIRFSSDRRKKEKNKKQHRKGLTTFVSDHHQRSGTESHLNFMSTETCEKTSLIFGKPWLHPNVSEWSNNYATFINCIWCFMSLLSCNQDVASYN